MIATDSAGKDFPACPERMHQAVCVDIVDLGLMDNKFNPDGAKQRKARIVWQVDEDDPETGKRFEVSRMYTVSLNEKASLRRDLQGWRGRAFTADELKGFDLEKLLGVNGQVNVVHYTKPDNGKVYANVQTIVPLSKGQEKIVQRDYVRVKDRDKSAQAHAESDANEEYVPF